MTYRFRPLRLALWSCTAMWPALATAQTAAGNTTGPSVATPAAGASAAAPADTQEQVEISAPGASDQREIVVTGRNIPNIIRSTPQVVSVLSSAEIARAGDGDIASALTRVTGLSVVGNGFVYVRGLGDRYSSALLNGLPLPSPEPLKRVVPLDLFPTSVVASAVVQKSYSANFPGEFGGGLINLTTPSVPKEAFLNFGVSGTLDTRTTARMGYTYYGSPTDFLGFDNGTRSMPQGLKDAIASGNPIVAGSNFTGAQIRGFATSLSNSRTSLLQRNSQLPANWSADLSMGKAWDLGAGTLGVTASGSYSNGWRTRDARQQLANDTNLLSLQRDFRTVITDNRAVLSGLLSVGYDVDRHKIRLTGLYIRDTDKQGRMAAGYNVSVPSADPIPNPDFYGTPPILQQNTFFFARQLIDTQAVGEFHFGDLGIDLRGGYANSQREAPSEREFTYTYNNTAKDYVNFMSRSGGQSAVVAFSDLNEDVWAGSADASYRVGGAMNLRLTAGGAYTDTKRDSSRYSFDYVASSALPLAAAQMRPDYLISDYSIQAYDIRLSDTSGALGTAAYAAELEVKAGYAQVDLEPISGVSINAGVRYEDAKQVVQPLGNSPATRLANNYWLPAATVTWNFAPDMQLRVAASKTIARPQFRELAYQVYQDPDSDRQFTGNPFLTDSQLTNAEGRVEYYPGRGERISLAGFYKRIKNPIEQVGFIVGGGGLRTGFANAPRAQLYGAEVEVVKYFPLDTVGGDFFADRRLLVSANYAYTKSELQVTSQTTVGPDLAPTPANLLFLDGAPLTGQSDHVANVQLGIESTDHLSQITLLANYSSKRVTNRGPIEGGGRQPDIYEKPGIQLDFVAREEIPFAWGKVMEIKFEARNLLGRKFQEYQVAGDRRVDVNVYRLGRLYSLGATLKF